VEIFAGLFHSQFALKSEPLIYLFKVISKGMIRVKPILGPIIALIGYFLGLTVFLAQNGVPSDLMVPFIGLWILCSL